MFFLPDDLFAKSPYESLFDLCTILVIAEDDTSFPLNRVIYAVDKLLHKGLEDGDVVVLATRALTLMFDKFLHSFSFSKTTGVVKALRRCFVTIFALVKKPHMSLRHEKTTERELKEELLNCLSLVSNCSEIFLVVPTTEEQLKFCFSALDGLKWTSCKVLRHCIGLMRRGGLQNVGDHEVMARLLQHHLTSLCTLDIDHEWDELLRTVVEGMVTYKVWCAPKRMVRRKRHRSLSTTSNTSVSSLMSLSLSEKAISADDVKRVGGASCGASPLKISTESLLAIGERVFLAGVAESRLQLTLACVSGLVEPSCCSPKAIEGALGWLIKLLQRNSTRTASYSSPFAHTRQEDAKGEQLGTGPFQPLPNLHWIVPPVLLSALVLVSKLLGADFKFCENYIWAGRDEGGDYYLYSKDIRQELSSMFFMAEENTKVLRMSHIMDVRNMTDTCSLSFTVSRIHFQPIPSTIFFDGKPVIPLTIVRVKGKILGQLLDTLRSLSFGHSQIAYLARALRLYVICGGPPTSSESTFALFRALAAEHKRQVVEEISSALIMRDKRWAPILLEAGVVKFIATSPAFIGSKDTTDTTHKLQDGQPILKFVGSSENFAKLSSANIPLLSELPSFFGSASLAELLLFIEELSNSSYETDAFFNVCSEIAKDSQLLLRLQSAVQTYTLRFFHQMSMIQQENVSEEKRQSLVDRVRDKSYIIGICKSEQNASNHIKCPNGHSLCVHFSVNWRCDVCNRSNAFGSLACRRCNYDVCSDCGNMKLSRMNVGVSAVVGDIIRAWRDCQTKEEEGRGKALLAGNLKHTVLFTLKGVLPASRLSYSISTEDVHFAEINNYCQCKFLSSSFLIDFIEVPSNDNPLQVFLRTFGAQRQQGDIESAIVDVLESCGADIFEKGILGIPERVFHVLQAIAPSLSLSFKRDTVHFLVIGCYRFGLYHLQDVDASVRGTVVGDIRSNGLATKFTVKRSTREMTQMLFDAFFQYPSLRNKVEFNFEGEEGTGEGPTQELYAEVSRCYRETMPKLWHEKDDGTRVAFPSLKQVFQREFFVMGACCGRAFVDGYTINLGLLPIVWPFIRSRSVAEEVIWDIFVELEPTLARSYLHLLNSTNEELEAIGLDFEDDGSNNCDKEKTGSGTPLTTATVGAYVKRCVEMQLEHAVANLRYFALGLSTVLDLSAFWFLTDYEVSVVLSGMSGADVDERIFTEEDLRAVVVEAHGYSPGSREVETMIKIVGGDFTREQQQFFLEFLTGTPCLPLNGLAGLGRKITVVRKDLEGSGELTLPSCNTCFLYFKLPPYTSRAIMRARLLTAVTEGRKNFSLS